MHQGLAEQVVHFEIRGILVHECPQVFERLRVLIPSVKPANPVQEVVGPLRTTGADDQGTAEQGQGKDPPSEFVCGLQRRFSLDPHQRT